MTDLDDLYQQFAEVHQQHNGSAKEDANEALDRANEFEGLTDGHFQVLMNFRSKRPLSDDDSSVCKRLEIMLKEERNTWRLVKALLKDQLLTNDPSSASVNGSQNLNLTQDSNRMDASDEHTGQHNGTHSILADEENVRFSEDQLIGNYYVSNPEIRRMQVIVDWLEANEAGDLAYKEEEDKAEFYAEGPTAWENTLHGLRATYGNDILDFDITQLPNAGIELCPAMDPDAPLRTKKSLAHQDKEIEIRLFKHLLRFIRSGRLDEGQEMAQRVGYFWLSGFLDGWLPYSDPNLDQENLGTLMVHQASEVRPVTGNKKRDVWKKTCYTASQTQGLNSCERAILGVWGGNIKSVLPVCHNWADQLWARVKCSIDVKIERALREPNVASKLDRDLIDLPEEFYANYQNFENIFKSIRDQKIVSQFKEATIHQTIQRYLILNDISGLLNQLMEWCSVFEFDNLEGSVSPHFLRCFAHLVLFLREIKLVQEDDPFATKIMGHYIALLSKQKACDSVAYYSSFLPKGDQTLGYAKLLTTINEREERRQCLRIAKEHKLDVDEITQTVVELIRNEAPETTITFPNAHVSFVSASTTNQLNYSGLGGTIADSSGTTKTTPFDRRKIEALDYLLLLDVKNYIAILHHGNMLLRLFASQRKMEALKEAFMKLPSGLNKHVEAQWQLHTNSEIPHMLRNNLRELDSFRALLETQEELGQWSEWHHKKPEEPKKPANLSKFCDNVNYEQRLKQYQQDLSVWKGLREVRTDSLVNKITEMFQFSGGWLRDIPTPSTGAETDGDHLMDQTTGANMTTITASEIDQCLSSSVVSGALMTTIRSSAPTGQPAVAAPRHEQLANLRRHFVPHMISICFNVLHLTTRYEDCLKLSHLLVDDELKLHEEFSKAQIRDFLDKMSEVSKLIVKQALVEEAAAAAAAAATSTPAH